MASQKTWVFLIICCALAVWLFFSRKPEPTSPKLQIFPNATSKSLTCFNSNDSRVLRRTAFDASVVRLSPPETFNFWVQNKSGFELGGPSHYTWGALGIYDIAAKVDVTNFASNTLWETGLTEGTPFVWKNQSKGIQYLRDAVDLKGIPNERYDFIMASHVIEHIANPFKALLEWLRILRAGGFLLVIAPYKDVTFDHQREVAKLEHLLDDYKKQTTEADLTHLEDIVRTHDIGRDQAAVNLQLFRVRSEKNFENRGMHQHVYDHELLHHIFHCLNLEVISQCTWSNSQLIVGKKK